MGEWVTSVEGDSFCSIAVACGFPDCQPIRDHQANQAIAGDLLQPGARVYVPDLAEQQDSAPVETTHRYILRAGPFASIRFVHGSRTSPIPADPDSPFLEVSNYRTDRAGADGLDPFAPAGSSAFDAPSDLDPDAFKVEVLDARTGLAQLHVTLEALHPIYLGDLAIGNDTNWSSAAEAARRKVDVVVRRVTPQPDQRFRSAYLRLVVDEADKAGRTQQTLLVTDDQPNEEAVEILDQEVRATYIVDRCPRPVNLRCRATKSIDVGDPANKKRIHLCVGIFRQNVGDATGINGTTVANLHHRVFHWMRRVYAQADCAPKVVPPGIRLLDPPERNMLTVSNITGSRATGRTTGGASPSHMSFHLHIDRGGGVVVDKDVGLDIARPANPGLRLTPKQVADQLVAAINDADFTASAFENPPVLGQTANQRSADIIVKDATAVGRVAISVVRNTDAGASLQLAVVNLSSVRDADLAQFSGTMDERQIIRNFESGDNPPDRLDCFVIGRWQNFDLRGRSFPPAPELANDGTGANVNAVFEPPPELRFVTMMAARSSSGRVMDGSDNLPYTFPHEAGHALMNMFHTTVRSELMASGGTSVSPVMRGTKRICDTVRIVFAHFHPRQTSPYRFGNFFESAVQRLRNFGAGLLEGW
ncbi:MAG: hypothetical protein ABSB23_07815 [Bryobacteraceae bacterium]|jgi:hypothetical protein